jgi:hypothetical protein
MNFHSMRMSTVNARMVQVSLLLLVGCVSVNKSILAPNPTGRTFTLDEVAVYFESDSIPEHTRLAILNAHGDIDTTDEADMIDELREEAGKVGANAIILGDIEEPGTGARIAGAVFGTTTERETQAIAIYVPSIDPAR